MKKVFPRIPGLKINTAEKLILSGRKNNDEQQKENVRVRVFVEFVIHPTVLFDDRCST